MNKIKTKIMLAIVAVTAVTALFLCLAASAITHTATDTTIEKILTETASVAASSASNTIHTYTYTIGEIATAPVLTDSATTLSEKKAFLDQKVASYYMRSAGLIGRDGKELFTGEDLSEEDYFKAGIAGASYMSAPYVNEKKDDMYLVVSAPVRNGEIIEGVVYFHCDAKILEQIISNITIGETGDAYILDKNGTTIAYSDVTLVFNQSNSIVDYGQNPGDKDLRDLALLEEKMVRGETGFGSYCYEGIQTMQAFTGIPGSDGWSIAVSVGEKEFMRDAYFGTGIMIVCAIVIGILAIIGAFIIGNSLAKPIIKCTDRLVALSKGDLKSPMEEVAGRDEISVLAKAVSELLHGLNYMISDLEERLSLMAKGDMTAEMNPVRYRGDFSPMQLSMEGVQDSLRQLVGNVAGSADQVFAGADQVAKAAQSLAGGASEQAAAVEELSANLNVISEQIHEIAGHSDGASAASGNAKEKLTEAIAFMDRLLGAIHEINDHSEEISKIVKTINSIAFQTNLIALNTAVEASRAGAAGAGFAVVADEVRKLSVSSAKAAKSISDLIEDSVSSAQKGVEIATLTSEALTEVAKRASVSGLAIKEISNQMKEQSKALEEMNESVDQISIIVQSNSCTSEESAASSEELSSQASLLMELVNSFHI